MSWQFWLFIGLCVVMVVAACAAYGAWLGYLANLPTGKKEEEKEPEKTHEEKWREKLKEWDDFQKEIEEAHAKFKKRNNL